MGRESTCLVRIGRESDEAKVLLESDAIVVRGALRRKIPLTSIRAPSAEGGVLAFTTDADGPVRLELGENEAAKWLLAIRHPKGVADKLGLKAGQRVGRVGALDPATEKLLLERIGAFAGDADEALDALFLAVERSTDLAAIPALATRLAPTGALWTVRRKGSPAVTEADVRAAGLAAGLVDVKVVSVSPALTAEKFVRPRAHR